MKSSRNFDYILAIPVCLLLFFGILALASVSAVFSLERYGDTTYYLRHQLIYGLLVGAVLGFFAYKINLDFFRKWAWLWVSINLALMILVFFPVIGVSAGGASRWLDFKIFSFQPSEFLKLSFIVYLSAWLAARKELSGKNLLPSQGIKQKTRKRAIGKWKYTLIPFLAVLGIVSLLLVIQSDLSTLGIIISSSLIMYFLANTPLWHTILLFLLMVGSALFLIKFEPYRMRRFLVFLKPETDPMGIGYQIKQVLIAVGSGGIFGLGFGMSNQKFGYIPQSTSDTIFAIYAEETGFIGTSILVLLFLLLFWKGIKIAKRCDDKFSKLLAVGIISWIGFQAFINIGAMIAILPLAGIPLPFISYGGSHLIAELIGIGLLFNISKFSQKL